ncbi:MAG: HigA family addiction module antitoxin [Alphaproteobacteria bacterium]
MRIPTHAGKFVKIICLPELGLTMQQAADKLGISRQMFYLLTKDNAPHTLTPEMALKFEKVFGGTAEAWLAMDQKYALYSLRNLQKPA